MVNRQWWHRCAVLLLLCLTAGCKKDLLHWQTAAKIETGTTARLNRALVLDDSTIIICGGQKFFTTEYLVSHDGGNTFQHLTIPEGLVGQYGICATPQHTIYTCGQYGNMLKSFDKGNTWHYFRAGDYRYYVGIAFVTENRGLAITNENYDAGAIAAIDSNGAILENTNYNFGLYDIKMATPAIGYASGLGVVMKTIDSGRTWAYTALDNDLYKAVYCRSAQDVWACGNNGTIAHTTNGGGHWDVLRHGNDILLPRYYLNDIVFTDDTHGYAVGEDGLIIYTDDAAKHWEQLDNVSSDGFNWIVPCPDGTLLAGGDNGALYKLQKK